MDAVPWCVAGLLVLSWLQSLISSLTQLAPARAPDAAPHRAGRAGLHAHALRHDLQRLDLPRRHSGLRSWLFPGLPPAQQSGLKSEQERRLRRVLEDEASWRVSPVLLW